jgi:hypothetical protein
MVPMEADPNQINDLLVKGGNQFEDWLWFQWMGYQK